MTYQYPLAGQPGQSLAEVLVVDAAETFDMGGVKHQKGYLLAKLVEASKGYTATFPHTLTGESVTVDFSHLKGMDPQNTYVTIRCWFEAKDKMHPDYQRAARALFPANRRIVKQEPK